MSTIVVVRKGRRACIAADTLTTLGDLRLRAAYDRHHDKIQRCGDSFIGIVGSAVHSLVVEDAFRRGGFEYDFSSRDGIFRTFVGLHAILKERYYLQPTSKNGEDDPYETSHIDAVIANRHGIFAVYALRDTSEFERFWAIGSGAAYALGAMHALYDRLDDAEAIARAGVAAGAEFDTGSDLPITSRVVELEG
ncbi:MAG: hypothetical protein KatS3mg121_1291 [Gammaproteobacteria bacterium]|nr:MAG: hypothetical protein KatS3mg121_1291 [Gammaproteobacteria bacterium]